MSVFLVMHTDCDRSDTVRFVCASKELAERCLPLEESPGWGHNENCCWIVEEEPLTDIPDLEHGPSSHYSPNQGPGLFSPALVEALIDTLRPLHHPLWDRLLQLDHAADASEIALAKRLSGGTID